MLKSAAACSERVISGGILRCLPQETLRWGMGIVDAALRELAHDGLERPMIFTVEPLLRSTDRLILPHLHDVSGIISDFPPHAPDTAIESALDRCILAGARSIVAYGGGSVLDAAKAVSHFHSLRQGRHLPIVALPTTLSGSEFSHYFGVTETSGARPFKRSYTERDTVPKIVLIDPSLLINTPRALLLSSAVKGLDHAIEGMRLVDVDHPHAIMAAARGDFLTYWSSGQPIWKPARPFNEERFIWTLCFSCSWPRGNAISIRHPSSTGSVIESDISWVARLDFRTVLRHA